MSYQLGEYLNQLRSESDLTLESISKKIKVRSQFLEQIERNQKIHLPKIIVKSYVKSYGKVVGADQKSLLEKFEDLYFEEQPIEKIKLPPKKTVSNLLIWAMICILLALSAGLSLSNKKQSRIETAEFKNTTHNNSKLNYSSPGTLEQILSSPSPSYDNNK